MHAGGENPLGVRLGHELSQTHEGRVSFRGGGVAAPGAGGEAEIRAALLPHADHRKPAFGPGNRLLNDKAALVQTHEEADPLILKPAGDFIRALPGALLRGGGGEPDVAGGPETLRGQLLRRLEHGPEAALVIQRAASPEFPLRRGPGEGRITPVAPGLDHVMMVQEQRRRQGGIPAAPSEGKAVGKLPVRSPGEERGKKRFQQLPEGMKLFFRRVFPAGNGLPADHFPEGAGIALRSLIHRLNSLFLRLSAPPAGHRRSFSSAACPEPARA